MLLNLQSLDIDIRDHEADEHADADEPDPHLDVYPSAEGMSRDHQSANQTDSVEKDGEVPGDTVDDDPAVSDERCKLNDGKESGRKDAREMEEYANLVACEVEVIVAFSRCRAVAALAWATFGTEISREVEVHEAVEDNYTFQSTH